MAIRITRVYTRTGDDGTTALVGGARVAKDSTRIEAYGTVDELNSVIGLVRSYNDEATSGCSVNQELDVILHQIQETLFDLGSELATPEEINYAGKKHATNSDVDSLESLIDKYQLGLEPLKSFVLPGGGKVSAHLHQCRTVCRRAERLIIRLSHSEPVNPFLIKYVNRLSDLFFVLSRWISKNSGGKEHLWQRGLKAR